MSPTKAYPHSYGTRRNAAVPTKSPGLDLSHRICLECLKTAHGLEICPLISKYSSLISKARASQYLGQTLQSLRSLPPGTTDDNESSEGDSMIYSTSETSAPSSPLFTTPFPFDAYVLQYDPDEPIFAEDEFTFQPESLPLSQG